MARIAHLTTAHPRRDIRIFFKECRSLAAHGHEVHLCVGDGKGGETIDNVVVHDIGAARGRFQRILQQPWSMLRQAKRLNADIYHFHDPELLPIGLLLSWSGHKVIYDSHEDLPRQILSKYWIKPYLRSFVSWATERFENFCARRFTAIVAAVPFIGERFAKLNKRTVVANNFPLPEEINSVEPRENRGRTVCYIGSISRIRGAIEMLAALEHLGDTRMILAGPIASRDLEAEMRAAPGWKHVDYRGMFNREELQDMLAESRAGLLLFHPEPNHVDAQPNKMFEYMAGGIPIVASDFPFWRELLDATGAGICVDPMNPQAIAQGIAHLMDNPEIAQRMGQSGAQAVVTTYRWDNEEHKLLALYTELA